MDLISLVACINVCVCGSGSHLNVTVRVPALSSSGLWVSGLELNCDCVEIFDRDGMVVSI